jgi:hypothetical protein
MGGGPGGFAAMPAGGGATTGRGPGGAGRAGAGADAAGASPESSATMRMRKRALFSPCCIGGGRGMWHTQGRECDNNSNSESNNEI